MAQYTTTYTALVSLLETFVADDSSEYTSNVQGIVNRAEDRVLRDLDTSIFNESLQTTTSNGVATLTKSNTTSPVRYIYMTAANYHLQRRSGAYVETHGGSGAPLYYSDDATTITLAPTPDASYSIKINQMSRPSPLTSSNTTNWLTQNCADLLLWAALMESEAFLIAPERVQEFAQNYAAALAPIRADWRELSQTTYDVEKPTPAPQQDR